MILAPVAVAKSIKNAVAVDEMSYAIRQPVPGHNHRLMSR